MGGNPMCKKQEHTMHICSLKERDFDKENPDEFKAIIENPKYKCSTCDANAKKSENLCKPVKL